MAQVNFKKDEFQGVLHFNVRAMEYEEELQQLEILINNFDDFNYYMRNLYKEKFELIFKDLTIESLEFVGVSFKGKQDSERFSVDMSDGWNRATIIFNEEKFGDVNIDKLNRIKKIIAE